MFKLAINAGHGYNTAGKRCLKALDPNETREYVLNKRICDKLQSLLSEMEGISILRIDDGTELSITQRTDRANAFDADFYLAVHHNAGINGADGGGIEAYVYLQVDQETLDWQSRLYNALIETTGLAGNRAQPLRKADLGEVRQTKMPAVLLECGYMDSATDVPIILSEQFADSCADALCKVIVQKGGLTPKAAKKSIDQLAREVVSGGWGNGDERKARLSAAGYDYASVQNRVNQLLSGGEPEKKSNAEIIEEVIAGKWGNGTERKNRLTAAGYNYSAIQRAVNERLK